MPNPALSRNERLYLQVETNYGVIPNTSGTATVGNSNACRVVKATLDNNVALIRRPDKTGSRSQLIGVQGRSFAQFTAEMSIAPGGTPGTPPDADPLFQAIMGQAGSVTSGTTAITAASNANPIALSTGTHGYLTNDLVLVSGVTGNTAANGYFFITVVDTTHFTLNGSTGNGVYVSGGTATRIGYKYTLADAIPSLSIWSFRTPSTIDQRVAFGAVAQEMTIQLGGDVATVQFSGEAAWINRSNQFSVASLTQKGGLTAFPSEPASPVTNGGMIAGFTGLAVVNGNAIATIRTMTLRNQTGNVTIKDLFGSYFPTSTEGDERNITFDMSIYEDDSAAYQNLIKISQDKTPVTINAIIGTVSGSVFGVTMNNVQLAAPTNEEQRRYISNWSGSVAHAATGTSRDELVLWTM